LDSLIGHGLMAHCIYRVEGHSWGHAQMHHETISKRIQNKHRN